MDTLITVAQARMAAWRGDLAGIGDFLKQTPSYTEVKSLLKPAAKEGQWEVIHQVLKAAYPWKKGDTDEALLEAIHMSYLKVIAQLLPLSSKKAQTQAILEASALGSVAVALFIFDRVDDGVSFAENIQGFARCDSATFQILLDHPRFDMENLKTCIDPVKTALQERNNEVVELLVPRVNLHHQDSEVLAWYAHLDQPHPPELWNLILQHSNPVRAFIRNVGEKRWKGVDKLTPYVSSHEHLYALRRIETGADISLKKMPILSQYLIKHQLSSELQEGKPHSRKRI